MKTVRRWKKPLIVTFVIAGLLTLTPAGIYGWVQWDAYAKADILWHTYYPQAPGRVEAAVLRMQDVTCSFRDRNRAVWVLGRLADQKALAALEKEYTGAECDHQNALCQYELRKAIGRCGGSVTPADFKTAAIKMQDAQAKEL